MFKSHAPIITRNDFVIEPGVPPSVPARAPNRVLSTSFFVIVAVLQVLDWHSTFLALSQGRSELNPFILAAARSIGVPAAVSTFKLLALSITGIYFLISRPYQSKKVLSVPLALVAFAYAVVVFNNYSH